MAREPACGGSSQRDVERTDGEPDHHSVGRQKHRKTLRLARRDKAETLQQPTEDDDYPNAVPVKQPAPEKPADAHREKGKGRTGGNPSARPTEGLGHRLQETAEGPRATDADAAPDKADGDNPPAVK